MRNLVWSVAAIALFACGPSSKEIAGAKTAHYKGDKLQLFAATKSTVEAKYKLVKSDETSLGMQTEARWYTPEGMIVTREGGNKETSSDMGGGMGSKKGMDSMVPDQSIHMALVVTLLPDGDSWVVKVTPLMERFHAGSPQTEPMKEGAADVPGWAVDKVDSLAYDIHKALSKYEVKGVPQMVPPATNAPPPDEPSGSAAPTAQGSAAPPAKP